MHFSIIFFSIFARILLRMCSRFKMAEVEVKDVEMEDLSEENTEQKITPKKDKDLLTIEDIRDRMKLIERGVAQKESRYILRAVRSIQKLRKTSNSNVLWKLVSVLFPAGTIKNTLLSFLDEPMETSTNSITVRVGKTGKTAQPLLPEIELFIHLLILLQIFDNSDINKAKSCSDVLMKKILSYNRRSLDPISAKAYYYHSNIHERQGTLASVRSFFHSCLRTSTLHYDEESQAILLNLLLRNYIHYNLYDQADKLVSKSTFPSSANNCELARYLFYLGRIRAIQLDYSEAYKHLIQAIRKAPQQSAVGFRQTAHKFLIVVQLLLGEIPDRATFRERILSKPLRPYFQLTQAVRNGDLSQFSVVLQEYVDRFQQDHTYTLIIRLHHNVIKTGIRIMSLSYSRISLKDIAIKLGLDDTLDAEYIVGKAIKDGVIEATIDHQNGYMQSKEKIDIYPTKEPQETFHERIQFCLDLYTQSIKAMRYPPKSYKESENVEELREKEQQLIEVVKMVDEDEEEEDFP